MQSVTISSSYRIAIPREFRVKYNIKPGEKMILMSIGDRIEMVPERKIEDMQGVLAGMDSDTEREKEDRI